MLNYVLTALIGIAAVVGSYLPRTTVQIWDDFRNFGAISYPTSLDSLTNPSGTDSVATVSHSGQHSNANDAIEAIEAKLGITGSTAVSNSILAGNGAGSSLWTTFPTTTNLTATGAITGSGLGTFGSLISQASSTIVGGLTITGNSTSTNATSTIGAFTNLATSTNYYGAGLQNCAGNQVLAWTSGKFSCSTLASSAIPEISLATSSNTSYLASTTAMTEGQKIVWNATCQRGADNEQLSIAYKLANHAASTTVFQFASAAADSPTGFGLFVATTSVTITVDMTGNGCDQGAELLVTLYK